MSRTILILAANPIDTPRLRLDQEVREIDGGLQRAKRRDEFILKPVWAVRRSDLRRAMLDHEPTIVHFSGHGGGESGIALEDENGRAQLVSAQALAGFFELFADKVECVLLNACFSQIQADAIAQHIQHVIGMSREIGDAAAIEFAVAFYDALGAGKSIEFAFKLACNSILLSGISESLTPILTSKSKKETTVPFSEKSGDDLHILVTGGKEVTPDIERVAHLVGRQVLTMGHILIDRGTRGVDKAAAEGAKEVCLERNLDINQEFPDS